MAPFFLYINIFINYICINNRSLLGVINDYRLHNLHLTMKKFLLGACVAATAIFSSCAGAASPIYGMVYTDAEFNQSVTANRLGSKVGMSSAKSIVCVATGNASVQEAAKSAGITKISHVDAKVTSILGVYATYTVLVYGE